MLDKLTIPIDEFTTPSPTWVTPEYTVDKVLNVFEEMGIRHMPVVEANRPVGILSQRDICLLSGYGQLENIRVGDVMIHNPYIVTRDADLDDVVYKMSHLKIGSALVTDNDGRLHGIFTVTDALNALVEILRGDIEEVDQYAYQSVSWYGS